MLLDSIGLFTQARVRMEWLAARHQLVAENVANADTPGFRARDLKPYDFQTALAQAGGRVTPSQTAPLHLAGLREPVPFREERRPGTFEISPDGNAVVLEEQMQKAAQTRGAYDMAAGITQKHVSMLRMAYLSR